MNRIKLGRLLRQTIRESDMARQDKFQIRMGLVIPGMRDAILDHVEDELGDATTQADGEIIKILLEYLPQILKFIESLVKLFG